jgi:hypothetical protein
MISATEFHSRVQDAMEADRPDPRAAGAQRLVGRLRDPSDAVQQVAVSAGSDDRQKALVDELMGIDVAVDSPSRAKHKSKPVLVADNR